MYGAFEPKVSPEEFVVVPDVKAISNGIVLICALPDGRRFGVPSGYIGEQSEVRVPATTAPCRGAVVCRGPLSAECALAKLSAP